MSNTAIQRTRATQLDVAETNKYIQLVGIG